METKVAVLSIIIDNMGSVEKVNELLHRYSDYIIGRMGLPYKPKHLNTICIALDAPMDKINALSGSLGRLEGVSAKASCAKA